VYVFVRSGDSVVLLKLAEIGPVATWSWWYILGVCQCRRLVGLGRCLGLYQAQGHGEDGPAQQERINRQKEAMHPASVAVEQKSPA
jgi:hypothetical protein